MLCALCTNLPKGETNVSRFILSIKEVFYMVNNLQEVLPLHYGRKKPMNYLAHFFTN